MKQPHFTYKHTIQFSETDAAMITHFSNYYKWMEMAEHALFRELDIAALDINPKTIEGWPRVHAECSFLKTSTFGDTIDIHLHIERLGASSIRYTFLFYRENTLVAEGKLTTAFCIHDVKENKLKSAPYSDSVREKLQTLIDNKKASCLSA